MAAPRTGAPATRAVGGRLRGVAAVELLTGDATVKHSRTPGQVGLVDRIRNNEAAWDYAWLVKVLPRMARVDRCTALRYCSAKILSNPEPYQSVGRALTLPVFF